MRAPGLAERGTYKGHSPLKPVIDAIKSAESHKVHMRDVIEGKYMRGPTQHRKHAKYLKQDHEIFARFFSQWSSHKMKQKGFDLPEQLAHVNETRRPDVEKFTPEELDHIGGVLEDVLKKHGLHKGLMAFLLGISQPRMRFVIAR